MRAWFAPFAGLSLMAAIGWSTTEISPIVNPPIRRERTLAGDTSLAGQFQTSASGSLWTYTEVYLNNGIRMRRMTAEENKERGLDDGQNHGTTIIPDAAHDFRGVFGDVERAVNAWSVAESRHHNDPRDCLPLFRLMTWLDPDFVEAWTTGAMVIGIDRTPASTAKAKAFLREGWKHNPDCVDIPMMFGMLEVTRNGDKQRGLRFFEKAVENGKKRFKILSDSEKAALQNAFHWQVLAYRNFGDIARLHEAAQEGLSYFPDDHLFIATDRPIVVPPKGYQPATGIRAR